MVKLKKLRESQDKLPIAQFKDEIIKTVLEKQVIIIAGMFVRLILHYIL
jgi:HrpA-like RNA helicase